MLRSIYNKFVISDAISVLNFNSCYMIPFVKHEIAAMQGQIHELIVSEWASPKDCTSLATLETITTLAHFLTAAVDLNIVSL